MCESFQRHRAPGLRRHFRDHFRAATSSTSGSCVLASTSREACCFLARSSRPECNSSMCSRTRASENSSGLRRSSEESCPSKRKQAKRRVWFCPLASLAFTNGFSCKKSRRPCYRADGERGLEAKPWGTAPSHCFTPSLGWRWQWSSASPGGVSHPIAPCVFRSAYGRRRAEGSMAPRSTSA